MHKLISFPLYLAGFLWFLQNKNFYKCNYHIVIKYIVYSIHNKQTWKRFKRRLLKSHSHYYIRYNCLAILITKRVAKRHWIIARNTKKLHLNDGLNNAADSENIYFRGYLMFCTRSSLNLAKPKRKIPHPPPTPEI